MSESKRKKNLVTKEIAMAVTPIAAAYLFITFYEAGFTSFYGLPISIIDINVTDVFLTNRLTLMVAVIAFLWIGLYYNVLPSANSPIFKGMITIILVSSLWLGVSFGKSDAKNKIEYLTLTNKSPHVVIKIYGNNVITAPYNKDMKTFEKSFTIHELGKEEKLTYNLQKVGPLIPASEYK